jgi:acyl-coenzyme A synthetase/AMP-(fatty) acid ligase
MLERTRLAVRRLLTMANLFENLNAAYGDREVLSLAEPLGYRLFPSATLSGGDCLHFTNLAAEAFIRDLDLKKGERVLILTPYGGEFMLLAAALIKAGGVVVPVDHALPAVDIRERATGCGATLAVVDGRVLEERPELMGSMPGIERYVATGPYSLAPQGIASLDEALEASSGFFLPYTLKPSNVAGLFYTELGGGSLKAVMTTNQGLLGPQLKVIPLLPSRPADLCVHVAGLDTVGGFSAAVLGLCMGLRMLFMAPSDPEHVLDAVEAKRPVVFMAASRTYPALLQAGAGGRELSSVRLWFAAGGPLPRQVPEGFRGFSRAWPGRHERSAAFVEAYDAGGRATMLALKPALSSIAWPEGCPGLVLPPNRAGVFDGEGRVVKGGREGELAIRGPSVTPGYWNDVEGTLAAKRDGWFRTGIKATRSNFLITLR